MQAINLNHPKANNPSNSLLTLIKPNPNVTHTLSILSILSKLGNQSDTREHLHDINRLQQAASPPLRLQHPYPRFLQRSPTCQIALEMHKWDDVPEALHNCELDHANAQTPHSCFASVLRPTSL